MYTKYLSLLVLLLSSGLLHAQSDFELITNTFGRENVSSLNGLWRHTVDPYETGFYDYRHKMDTGNGWFLNKKPANKSERIEYDWDKEEQIRVPGDWNSQNDKFLYYEGTIWYKRDFDYDLSDGKRLFVYFGAANYETKAFVNGKFVGEHEGGFTPFQFEITEQVKKGKNFIIVKVDNKRKLDAVPTVNTDWWNYGGLTRDVKLIETKATFIEDYYLQLKKGSTREFEAWVQLNGKDKVGKTVKIEIPELKKSVTATTDKNGYAKATFKAKPKLWSPESPKRYDVKVSYGSETVTEKIGFRTIEVSETEIILNGKPLFLRGICIHEENPIRISRARSPEDANLLLGWAKELNCNFVRLAHYPHNEHMTRAADSMGIMLWSEVPVYWTIQFESKAVLEKAKTQMTENIMRDKNKACIIIWSVGNETPVSEARTKFMTEMVRHTKGMDPSRLVSAALEINFERIEEDGAVIDDPLGKELDVLSSNEYFGWYGPFFDEPSQCKWSTPYKKPFIVSETGGGALQGFNADAETRWSEEFQEKLYIDQLAMLENIPFLRGLTPWIIADFRSPKRVLPGIQNGWNRKGLISENGQKKKAFFVLRKWYDKKEKASK